MADTITTTKRSEIMRTIRSRDTGPEITLRSALHRRGFRFRVCRKDLPGTPDIVFVRQRLAVFVHGCFWHQHNQCRDGRLPKSRRDYWEKKLHSNVERDKRNNSRLREMGWRVVEIWECEIRDRLESVVCELTNILEADLASPSSRRS